MAGNANATKALPLIKKLKTGAHSVRLNEENAALVADYLKANNLENIADLKALLFHLLQTPGTDGDNTAELELLKADNTRLQRAITDNFGKYIDANDNHVSDVLHRIRTMFTDAVIKNAELQTFKESLQKRLEDWNDRFNILCGAILTDDTARTVDEMQKDTLAGIEALKATPAIDTLAILDTRPALGWFKQFVDDKTKDIGDVLLNYRAASDFTIHKMMLDPLTLLAPEDYETLLKWDAEVFLPALADMIGPEVLAEYGIQDLSQVLTGEHKFMMFWDFVLSDPAAKIREIVPQLTPEQHDQLRELSFPRMQIVQQCLADIADKNKTLSENLNAENHANDTEENIQPEESEPGRVVALNANRTDTATQPETTNENTNKPIE